MNSVATIAQGFSVNNTSMCAEQTMEPAFNFKHVSESEVLNAIKLLKPSRARGVFGIDTIMLEDLKDRLVNPITNIANLSISKGLFPSIWKSAVVTPIFKGGDPQVLGNYRPISILPIVSKVIEKLVAGQIVNYSNTSSFDLHPMQFGFRANHSADTANWFFTEKVKSLLDKGGSCWSCVS